MIIEKWKDIFDYEGLYQISNLGRVKSITHIRKNGNKENHICISKGKILKPGKDSGGYMVVVLSKEGKTKSYRVHRLVANTFMPNPNNYRCVNHIDENKTNNNVKNLEWCTYKHNNSYGTRPKNISKANSIKINQYDKEGKFIKQWNSMIEAEKTLNIKRASVNISACCKHKKNNAYGYIWRYANGDPL